MFEVSTLSKIPPLSRPCALTIGCFDGVHLGHQAILRNAHARVGPNGSVVLLTFSNHPAEFFSPEISIPGLCSPKQKLLLLEKEGIDCVINLEFNQTLATLSPKAFLTHLKEKLPFSHLILGSGACMGQNQEGDEAHLKTLQKKLDFSVDYLSKSTLGKLTISSGLIRKKIQENDLRTATALLGRPYSLLVDVDSTGKASAEGLCLPPKGSYLVTTHSQKGQQQERIQIAPSLFLPNLPQGRAEIVF